MRSDHDGAVGYRPLRGLYICAERRRLIDKRDNGDGITLPCQGGAAHVADGCPDIPGWVGVGNVYLPVYCNGAGAVIKRNRKGRQRILGAAARLIDSSGRDLKIVDRGARCRC